MFEKVKQSLRKFFSGRYGVDQLNLTLLYLDLAMALLALLLRSPLLNMFTYIPMGYILFRMLSRNTYSRYQENRRYLQMVDRLKDRKNRYYRCPKCKQMIRVPKGKGKIAITCPRCKEKFIKKT